MYANIKLSKQHIADFQNILTLMYHLNYNFITYMEFWSIGKLLNKVAKFNYSSAFSNKKIYSLRFEPNEIESFILLVAQSENILQQTPYYNSMMLDITNQLHKHVIELEHQKKIFISNQTLTIPKLLSHE